MAYEYEQARKFCRLCHKYSRLVEGDVEFVIREEKDDKLFEWRKKYELPQLAPLIQARDFAMSKAIELLNRCSEERAEVSTSLKACESCDYSEPRIAKILGKEDSVLQRLIDLRYNPKVIYVGLGYISPSPQDKEENWLAMSMSSFKSARNARRDGWANTFRRGAGVYGNPLKLNIYSAPEECVLYLLRSKTLNYEIVNGEHLENDYDENGTPSFTERTSRNLSKDEVDQFRKSVNGFLNI